MDTGDMKEATNPCRWEEVDTYAGRKDTWYNGKVISLQFDTFLKTSSGKWARKPLVSKGWAAQ